VRGRRRYSAFCSSLRPYAASRTIDECSRWGTGLGALLLQDRNLPHA
jgi:hypothetical protein